MLGLHHSKTHARAALLLASLTTACGSDAAPAADVDAGHQDLDAGALDAGRAIDASTGTTDTGTPSLSNDASAADAGAQVDAGGPDGGQDAGTFPCTSTTAATSMRCGGAHCQQAPVALRLATPTGATCGTDDEVASLCSLEAPGAVGECAVAALFGGPSTKTCAAARLPKVRGTCIDCYVASADCTRDHCLQACSDLKASECDACRIREGCMAAFYTCAGVPSPYPAGN